MATKGYLDSQAQAGSFLKTDGSNFVANSLNLNDKHVKNRLDPSDEQDAVNKRFLESRLDDYLNRKGQIEMVADLDMDGYKITKLKNADASSDPADAVNKKYLDERFNTKLDAIPQAEFNVNNNSIVNLAPPTELESATNKPFVDDNCLSVFGANKMLASLDVDGKQRHQPS